MNDLSRQATRLEAIEGSYDKWLLGAIIALTGVGVVMGCRVLDERVVVADCASTVPAAASRPHSTRPRAEEEIVMSGTTLHER